ncbi:endo-1,6-alpha-mannosidase [Ceratobasidium sp. AG-I]|nr:endo-1,6-alpha-mannosidase [Ceratobasidium sp. AG-I]
MSRFAPLLFVLPLAVSAADLGVPLSWRKFSNSRSVTERQNIAQAAIDNIKQYVDTSNYELNGLGYWGSANSWSAMALKDKITGTQANRGIVSDALGNNIYWHPHYYKYEYNDDAMWWGTANIYAYRAYKDSILLGYAVDNWNEVSKYVVTAAQASAGKHPLKTSAIKGTCGGTTMAGGVFWTNKAADTGMNAITTGLYMTLSAYLAEATGDSKYTAAAILSANWIKNHRYQTSTHLVLDSLNAVDCSTSADSFTFTYNSGKFVEGLAVLADVTKDQQWTTLMTETVAAAVKSTKWQGSDGIITEGQDGDLNTNNDGRIFKAVFIRGLHEVFQRSVSNNDLRILIHSYVDVQYNALLDLTANGASYGVVWHGPYNGPTSWGQNAAVDILVAAIGAN